MGYKPQATRMLGVPEHKFDEPVALAHEIDTFIETLNANANLL
jgi:hypothetical protein